jgi:CBS domain-containing protein
MDKNRIGALLVYCSDSNDPQDLEGIVTERDIIELVARKGKESLKGDVNEIMSKNIISVTPQCNKIEALDLMMENQIRHLAVMDQEKLVGVLSMRDLIKQL